MMLRRFHRPGDGTALRAARRAQQSQAGLEAQLLAALSPEEREQLRVLLRKAIAGIHEREPVPAG